MLRESSPISQNNHAGAKIILDLGCGKKKRDGSIGVDFSDRHGADVIHDLNVYPYPFDDNYADEIYMDNVLEHLADPIRVMSEIHRISKDGGLVKVIVPYFRSRWAFIDPTHKNYFTVESFAYYDPRHWICQRFDYTDTRYFVRKIIFNELLPKRSWFHGLIKWYANRRPHKYEKNISQLYPMDDISFYLEKCRI